jgi:hypothetical protein
MQVKTKRVVYLASKRSSFHVCSIVAGNGERWSVPRSRFAGPESESGTRAGTIGFGEETRSCSRYKFPGRAPGEIGGHGFFFLREIGDHG